MSGDGADGGRAGLNSSSQAIHAVGRADLTGNLRFQEPEVATGTSRDYKMSMNLLDRITVNPPDWLMLSPLVPAVP